MLQVDNLQVRYGRQTRGLQEVSIAVGNGEVVALLGSNGAGKSTLLRAVSGTLRMHGGTVERGDITYEGTSLLGRDPADIVRAGLVQVPERRRIFTRLSVEENLQAGGVALRSRSRAQTMREIVELFPLLRERRRQMAGLLSGGEQQILAIGRALMARPRFLLLDEPSLGLAPKIVKQVAEIIRMIHGRGASVLLVEQNAAMALSVSRRGYVLEAGALVIEGDSRDLRDDDAVRRAYVGANGTRGIGGSAGHAGMASA